MTMSYVYLYLLIGLFVIVLQRYMASRSNSDNDTASHLRNLTQKMADQARYPNGLPIHLRLADVLGTFFGFVVGLFIWPVIVYRLLCQGRPKRNK